MNPTHSHPHAIATNPPHDCEPADREAVAGGHNFTAAQIELQRQIGQCDGFPAIQTVLRAQLMRSLSA